MGRSSRFPDCNECQRLQNLMFQTSTDYFAACVTFHLLDYTDARMAPAISTMRKAICVRDESRRQFDKHLARHDGAATVINWEADTNLCHWNLE